MKCPICGTSLRPDSERCPDCGYHCRPGRSDAVRTEAVGAAAYTPPNRTKSPKCCCCALILVIPAIIVIASLLIFGFSQVAESFPEEIFEEIIEDFPFEEMTPETMPLPDAADESCFRNRNGILQFVPENWDGNPVLRIPELIGGEPVTTIGPGCFSDCSELTTIVLPETVISIKPGAFSGCTQLRGMYLPEGLETIGADAFAGCEQMQAICIPASVTSIASGCFDDCASLMYIIYSGNFEDWNALYSDYITPFTAAICFDGDYYHGARG